MPFCYQTRFLWLSRFFFLFVGVKRFVYISAADFGLVNYLLQGYYDGKVLYFVYFYLVPFWLMDCKVKFKCKKVRMFWIAILHQRINTILRSNLIPWYILKAWNKYWSTHFMVLQKHEIQIGNDFTELFRSPHFVQHFLKRFDL